LIIAAPPTGAETKILTVGTSGSFQYRTISAAVAAADADGNAQNYYDIQVSSGTYTNDFSLVTRPMTIEIDRRRPGNPVLVKATVPLPNQKRDHPDLREPDGRWSDYYGGDDR
jgi:pectin methylesterase-like acyl-CoA thioesterase